MSEDIMAFVVKHLLEELEKDIKPEDVTRDTRLQLDLGLDSMQAVTLVMDFEQEFDTSISDDELLELKTVGDLVDIIKKKLSEKEKNQ